MAASTSRAHRATTVRSAPRPNGDYGPLGAQAERLLGDDLGAQVNIVNMLPALFEPNRLEGAHNIGYSMWEADRLPERIAHQAREANLRPEEWGTDEGRRSPTRAPQSVVGGATSPPQT